MKLSSGLCKACIAAVAVLAMASPSRALPVLQLDISGARYDALDETVKSTGAIFTLYALLTPSNASKIDALLADDYFISAALTPKVTPDSAGDLGSFKINTTTVSATSDMFFGVPPLETFLAFDSGDLQHSDMFETYFWETPAFKFNSDNTVATYNVQDDPGGFTATPGDSYYVAFDIDTTGLADGYEVHFDLYSTIAGKTRNITADIDRDSFAPFSHDAQSDGKTPPIPEPATMLLFGTGLIGFAGWNMKRRG